MDFTFSEEQTLLKNSVERFIADRYDFTTRMKLVAREEGFAPDNWAFMAEQGWLAVPFAEEVGGFGFSLPEIMILMEAFGSGLVVEPYLSTIVVGGGAVHLAGSPDQQHDILPAVIAGECLLAFAHQEAGMRHDPAGVALSAGKDGNAYRLTGEKRLVLNATTANHLVVTARTSGNAGDRSGLTLFLVDRSADGLSLRPYRTVDGLLAADIVLDNVTVPDSAVLGAPGEAHDLLVELFARANVAMMAEAVGAMRALFEATRDYVATRKQFGRAIGSFQVIQHRMADLYMGLEQSVGMLYRAALTRDDDPRQWLRNVSAARVFIDRAARRMGHEAIQFHGGIGMTDELSIGHYHKRLLMLQSLFGDIDYHRSRFRALGEAA
ncbi:MAG: pimeloyl-CoA dehydrogenase small subunit [Alphaproteobacteria bacterium]|nr:MAG: pimeloyl-CoA dehydrogenase small subunit [Alphaproteobacteria bacterium]